MITGLILAAGESQRMGVSKQLLPWGEGTVLEKVIDSVRESGKVDDQLRVILGAEAEKIENTINKGSSIQILYNQNYKKEMLESIKTGLKELPDVTEHILISLGDQPLIDAGIISEIVDNYLKDDRKMIVPRYKESGGHPVVIEREFLLENLENAEGPGGLRQFLEKFPEDIYFYEMDRKEITIDLDFYDEYKKFRKKYAQKQDKWILNYKFWLEGEDKKFGDGPCDILLRIDRFGSLKKAAEDIDMSYSQAWKLIAQLESNLGFNLIEKQVGGKSGGGSELTPRGRKLMNDFLCFRKEIHEHIVELEKKYFSEWNSS